MDRQKFEVHYYVDGKNAWMHIMAYDKRDAQARATDRIMKHQGRVAVISHVEPVKEPALFLV